jgi:hypothetical protein
MRRLALLLVAAMSLAVVGQAVAHPDKGEVYVPWMDRVDGKRLMRSFMGDDAQFQASAAPSAPGTAGMTLVGNSDKDGTINSDLAFWGNLAYSGNYDGFRILDISGAQPQLVVDHKCRGPQNDVSVYEIGGKRYLFQSIDTPQSAEDCTSADNPLWPTDSTKRTPGFEGIRMFDVTDPANPQFVKAIQTACGSHTHTLVPGGDALYIYVSSYPLGSGITPADYTGPLPRCEVPHRKISIISVPYANPTNTSVREEPLSSDTTPNAGGMQACHDIQVYMPKNIAVASCAGDTQIWSVANPANPTASDGEPHTHIRSPSAADQFEFMHSAFISWDGKKFGTMDETGGGVTAECDGEATQDGFYYFYKMVTPGSPAPPLEARYTIPRPQTPEICVSHNGNVLPLRGQDVAVASYYQGGNSVIDFTDLDNVREIAWSDLADATGLADSWSTYWYNGRVYANGGLNRRGATGNRGFDAFTLDSTRLQTSKRWAYSNPQTQEGFQRP